MLPGSVTFLRGAQDLCALIGFRVKGIYCLSDFRTTQPPHQPSPNHKGFVDQSLAA